LVWNGPLGAFETPPFERGTIAVAKRVAELTRAKRLLSVAGGGDTVAALAQADVTGDLSYVSTAGGAFLEWLEGRELPGVATRPRRSAAANPSTCWSDQFSRFAAASMKERSAWARMSSGPGRNPSCCWTSRLR